MKFNTSDVKVYLPEVVSTEGEWKELAVEQLSKLSGQKLIESTDVINPLGDNFEHQPDIEGHPKHIRQESAAIKRLHTSEGVLSVFLKSVVSYQKVFSKDLSLR